MPLGSACSGPFSMNMPISELQPGPPIRDNDRGSSVSTRVQGHPATANVPFHATLTLKPNNERIRRRVVLTFREPIEQVATTRLIDGDVPTDGGRATTSQGQHRDNQTLTETEPPPEVIASPRTCTYQRESCRQGNPADS